MAIWALVINYWELFIEWEWGAGGWGKTTSFLNQVVTSSGQRKQQGLSTGGPYNIDTKAGKQWWNGWAPGENLSGWVFTLGNQVENRKEWTGTKTHLPSSFLWEIHHRVSPCNLVDLFNASRWGHQACKLPTSRKPTAASRENVSRKVQMGSVFLRMLNWWEKKGIFRCAKQGSENSEV